VFYLPSMPAIVKEFNINHITAQYAISLFIIGQAIIPLFLGYLGDRFNLRKVMAGTMLLFSLSCFLMLIFPTAYGLLVCRFLQGGFSQAGITLSRAMIKGSSTYHQTVKILSWLAVLQSFVHIIGPFLGGWVIEHTHWWNNFYILGGIGIILFFVSIRVPDKLQSLNCSLNNISASYIRQIFLCPYFLGYSFIVSTLHFCTIFFFSMSPFYFITFCKISPENFGVYLGITSVGFIAGSIFLPIYLHKFNHDKILIISLFSAILVGLPPLFFLHQQQNLVELIILSQFLYAFIKALISPILQSKAMDLFPKLQATGASAFNFISTLTASFGSMCASFFSIEIAVMTLSLAMIFTSVFDFFLILLLKPNKQKKILIT